MSAALPGNAMGSDAFSGCHPAVNFVFFLGAIGFGVVILHPAYLLAGAVGAAAYYLLLHGKKGWKMIFGLFPLFLVLTAINPLLNTQGQTIFFRVFGRPYTAEALLYGAMIAGIFVVTLLWFGCYHAVMTSDKFTSLFGNWALSLMLVMVLRLIPNLLRKARQIAGARRSVGRGAGEQNGNREKLTEGMTVLSVLISWALEGGVGTADSMRSRGYGVAKRTSFQIYRMTPLDRGLLAVILFLAAAVLATAITGGASAVFIPAFSIAPISGLHALGFAAYCCYLLIPTVLHIKEAIQWSISRSRI